MYSYRPIYPCKMVHNLYFWQFKSFFVWTIFYRHQCTCRCRLESVTGENWMGPYTANKSYRVFTLIKCIKNVLYSTQCSVALLLQQMVLTQVEKFSFRDRETYKFTNAYKHCFIHIFLNLCFPTNLSATITLW